MFSPLVYYLPNSIDATQFLVMWFLVSNVALDGKSLADAEKISDCYGFATSLYGGEEFYQIWWGHANWKSYPLSVDP